MVSQWWSVALTVFGLVGLFFTMRKHIAGPALGAVVQVLWVSYAVVSNQYAFIVSALCYGALNVYGLVRWSRE